MAYSGPFPAHFTGVTSEILVSGTNFSGGVTNAGTVSGGGIVVVSSTFLTGGIINTKLHFRLANRDQRLRQHDPGRDRRQRRHSRGQRRDSG